jgi:hypothetical protein
VDALALGVGAAPRGGDGGLPKPVAGGNGVWAYADKPTHTANAASIGRSTARLLIICPDRFMLTPYASRAYAQYR